MLSVRFALPLLFLACAQGEALPPPPPVGGPQLAWSPAALEFNDVPLGASAQRTLTLSNPGQAPLEILRLVSTSSVFVVESAVTSVGPGENLPVEVRFLPVRLGRVAGELLLESNAIKQPRVELAVLGTGIERSPCDDGNSCTDDARDPATGQCTNVAREGRCDDGSACTQEDRCEAGTCVGEPVTCDDGVACTQDLCDPRTGCGVVLDDARCVDQDPCTEDRCEATGCQNPTAPDGYLCGERLSCVHQDVCQAGRCVRQAIVDGAPCSDDDRCTLDDRCSQGACVGTATLTPGALIATTWSIDGVAAATFAEGHLYASATERGKLWILAEDAGRWATIAEAPGLVFGNARLFDMGGQRYARVATATAGGRRVEVLDLSSSRVPRVVSARALPPSTGSELLYAEEQFYSCGAGGLASVDLSDPTRPGVPVLWASDSCAGRRAAGGPFVASWFEEQQPGPNGGFDTVTTLRIERLGRGGPVPVLTHQYLSAEFDPPGGIQPPGPILRVALDERRLLAELSAFERYLWVDLEAASPTVAMLDLSALGRSNLAGVAGAIGYLTVGDQLRALDLSDPSQPTVLGYSATLPGQLTPVELLARGGDRLALRANNGRLLVVPRLGAGPVALEPVGGQGKWERLHPTSAGLMAVGASGARMLRPDELASPTVQNAPQLPSPWFEGPGFTEATLLDGPDGPLTAYFPSGVDDPDPLALPQVSLSSDGLVTLGGDYGLEDWSGGDLPSRIVFDGCVGLASAGNSELLLLDRCVPTRPAAIASTPIYDISLRQPCSRGSLQSHGAGYFSAAFRDGLVLIDASLPAALRILEVPWSVSSSCLGGAAVEAGILALTDIPEGYPRLRTFDVTGPAPVLLRTAQPQYVVGGVRLLGGRAYLSARSLFGGRVEVIDLRPDPPVSVESVVLPGDEVVDFLPFDGLLYLLSASTLNVMQPGCEGP